MKMCSSYRGLLSLATAATIGVSACGDGGGGPPTGPVDPAITVESGTAQVGTVMSVRVEGLTLSQATYAGTLAGAPLEFVTRDDSTLVAYVPEVPVGAAEVVLEVGAETVLASANIVAGASIANPVSSVETALDDAIAAFSEVAPEGQSQAEWTARREAFIEQVEASRSDFLAASAEDQLAAARLVTFLQAELARLDAETGAALSLLRYSSEVSCNEALRSLLKASSVAVVSLGVVIGSATIGPIGILFGGLGAAVFYEAGQKAITNYGAATYACGSQQTVAITGSFDGRSAGMMSNASAGMMSDASAGAAPSFTFVRQRELAVTPVEEFQELSPSQYDDFATMVRAASITESMHEMLDRAPDLVQEKIRPYLPARPSTLPEKPIETRGLLPSGVTIANVTNGVSLTIGGDSVTMTLRANAPNHDRREFTFDLVSTTDNSVRRRYEAVLEETGAVIITAISETMQGQWSWDYGNTDLESLECPLYWDAEVIGSEPIEVLSMTHTNSAAGQETITQTDEYTDFMVPPGEYVQEGRWYRTWPLGVHATDFSVSVSYAWRNPRTGETGNSNVITMRCLHIDE